MTAFKGRIQVAFKEEDKNEGTVCWEKCWVKLSGTKAFTLVQILVFVVNMTSEKNTEDFDF